MSGQTRVSFRRRAAAPRRAAPPGDVLDYSEALLIIDQRRLQSAAWARLHTARKRLEKAARDLHRHEEIDSPAYQSWLHRTFPILVTTLRELQDAVAAMALKIQRVQAMAYTSGRSIKRLWREEKERDRHRARMAEERETEGAENESANGEEDPVESFKHTPPPERSQTARDIYRRLVQRLHPDRGGEWTAARQRLWHEVQQAWAAGDTDWLSRLEIEWETAHELLSPTSPLSRLYRAIEELDAARRDTERKLSEYRYSPAWRFTLTEKKRDILQARVEARLHRDIAVLRREMKPLQAMIAAWEEDWTRGDQRVKSPRHPWRRR